MTASIARRFGRYLALNALATAVLVSGVYIATVTTLHRFSRFRANALTTSDNDSEKGCAMDATNRCDRCGAQALVMVLMEASELLFCNHHAHKYQTALLAQGGLIVEDDREAVTA